MRRWLDEKALRLAYRLISFTRPLLDDINDDSKLEGAQHFIAEVVTRRFAIGARA